MEIWRKYLVGKNMKLSETSKRSYESDIYQWFIFILDRYNNKCIFDINAEDMSEIIEDYVAFCSSVLNNKTKRIARRLSSISSIYVYYKKKRKIKDNPLELIERPQADHIYEIRQTFLSKEQVELIKSTLKKSKDLQLELFFCLGLSCMARVNALSNIKIEKINLTERIIEDVIEKEGYEVTLFFSAECAELIKKWIDYRKKNNIENEYLFITRFSGEWVKVDKSVMQKNWIKKIGKIINEPELHCHDLRHSGSNLLFQAGMPIESVSKLLNHAGLDVTKLYITIDKDKIKNEKDQFET